MMPPWFKSHFPVCETGFVQRATQAHELHKARVGIHLLLIEEIKTCVQYVDAALRELLLAPRNGDSENSKSKKLKAPGDFLSPWFTLSQL